MDTATWPEPHAMLGSDTIRTAIDSRILGRYQVERRMELVAVGAQPHKHHQSTLLFARIEIDGVWWWVPAFAARAALNSPMAFTVACYNDAHESAVYVADQARERVRDDLMMTGRCGDVEAPEAMDR